MVDPAALSADEQAALTAGADLWSTNAIPRAGIPSIGLTDGPSGARGRGLPGETPPSTCIPSGSAVGATWDPDLAEALGALLATEARARDCNVLLAPNLNLHRHPLAGRNFECYGEDPLHAGVLGAAFVRGVQSQGVAATIKHLVANESELERSSLSSVVDERTLREIYLRPFEIAVRDGAAMAVMTAYNRVNGRWVTEWPELLQGVLRDEWGFDGLVMTDWFAVASASSLAAGVDLEMPGPPRVLGAAVVGDPAVATAAAHILGVLDRLELGPAEPAAGRRLCRAASAAAMVLLRNEGVLPLAPGSPITVLGPNADEPAIMGGGSSQVTPRPLLTARQALAEVFDVVDDADVAVVIVGTGPAHESEGRNRASFALPDGQDELVRDALARHSHVVVVVNTGAAHDLPWVDDVDAVLQCWFGGEGLAPALADVLSGGVDPGGRLPCSFPERLEHVPAHGNFPGENGEVRYGEGLFMGYRGHDARGIAPRFPFGHGLSYATFDWHDARLDGDTVRVTVTNTGSRTGSDVVQIYVSPPVGRVARPVKELRAFHKVTLDPGASVDVALPVDDRWFAYWDPGQSDWYEVEPRIATARIVEGAPYAERRAPGWYVDPGEHAILVARSAGEVVFTLTARR